MESPALESSPTGLLSVAEIEHLRRASIADFDSFGGDDEEEITTVIARLPSDVPVAASEEAFVASLPRPVAPPSVRIAMGPVAPPGGARAGVFSSTAPLAPPSPAPASRPPQAPPSSSTVRAVTPRPPVLTAIPPSAPRTFPPGDSVFPPSTLAPHFDPYAPPTMTASSYQWSVPQPTVSPALVPSREIIPRWAKVYFAFVAVILAASAAGWIVTR